MIFYFNNELGVCVEKDWVVEYLYRNESFNSRKEIQK